MQMLKQGQKRLTNYFHKAMKAYCTNGIPAIVQKIWRKLKREATLRKLRSYHIKGKRELFFECRHRFSKTKTFSIITPLYNTPEVYLKEMIDSVLGQTYPHWQLCLTDGSDNAHAYVGEICTQIQKRDTRITYQKLLENRGISENTNACIAMASGDFLVMLDHDDMLHPSALFSLMETVEREDADFIYTDEIKFSDSPKNSYDPNLKPDFSIEELRSHNFICHLVAYKRSLLDKIGLYNPDYDGSQDHDMMLRLSEVTKKIVHIPHILYYWRVHSASVSYDVGVKQYAVDAAQSAIRAHLSRCCEKGFVSNSPPFQLLYRIEYPVDCEAMVTIIIYGADIDADSILCEQRVLTSLKKRKVQIIHIPKLFDITGWDPLIHVLDCVEGEYLLFLNASFFEASDYWLEEMLMFAQKDHVGAVSAKVYDENNLIIHAGITLSEQEVIGVCSWHAGCDKMCHGYEACLRHVRRTTGVWEGCLLTKTKYFLTINNFSETPSGYWGIDYCLALAEMNLDTIWTPFCEVGFSRPSLFSRISANSIESFRRKWTIFYSQSDRNFNKILEELGYVKSKH